MIFLGLFPFQWGDSVTLGPSKPGIELRAKPGRLEFVACENKLEVKADANRLEFRSR